MDILSNAVTSLNPCVYAIMITGKDQKRVMFSRFIGLKNFNMQTYKNKKLIIINHGDIPVMTQKQDNVYEIKINKRNMTLGDLRNFSLTLIPLNAISLTFDDDDWRVPTYIEFMLDTLLKTKSTAVFMKNRLEYNLTNGFSYRSFFDYGSTHMMCIKLEKLQYLSKDTLEDIQLQSDLKSFNKKYTAIDNDPKMYLRIIHENNTSPNAAETKNSLIKVSDDSYYKEFDIDVDNKAYIDKIIRDYYSLLK